MRVGIDCRDILNSRGEMTGIGQYIFYLTKNLISVDKMGIEWVLFFSQPLPHRIKKKLLGDLNIKIIVLKKQKIKLPYIYSHFLVPRQIEKFCDKCIFPANIIPLGYKGKAIVVVHDLAIYKYPQWFENKQFFSTKILVPRSLKKAKHIVCVSHNTKKDLTSLFNVSENKISVIYPDACLQKSEFNPFKEFNLQKEYFLYLGSLEPRKNILNLLNAFEQFYKKNNQFQLVLAGGKGWKNQEIIKKIKLLTSKKIVKYLGYISESKKYGLLKNAIVFVFPSLYEGFGLPVLEAIKLQVPVITSNISSLPEVVGQAGILIDPTKQVQLVKAFDSISDEKIINQLKQKSLEQAQKFDWQKTAKQFIKIITSI